MLQLKNISRKFNGEFVLDNINYTFNEKGLYYIVGESGSGKTTLINLIARLDKEDGGSIFYNGLNLTSAKPVTIASYRHNVVGMIFQNYNLVPTLNIKNNFNLVNGRNNKRYDKYISLLNRFKVIKLLNNYPYQLSGGEQQRVALARTLAFNYKIILADEPTGSLDRQNSEIVMEELVKASKDSLVIVITHDFNLTKSYKGKILKIEKGKLIGNCTKNSYFATVNLTSKKIDLVSIIKNSIESIKIRIANYTMLVVVITLILSSLFIVLSAFNGFRNYREYLSSSRIDSNYFTLYKYVNKSSVALSAKEVGLDDSMFIVKLDCEDLFNRYIKQLYSLPNNEFYELKIISSLGTSVMVNSLFDDLIDSSKIDLSGSLLIPYQNNNKISYEKITFSKELIIDNVIPETKIYNVPKLYLSFEHFLSLFENVKLPLIAEEMNTKDLSFEEYHTKNQENIGLNGLRFDFKDYYQRKKVSDSLLIRENVLTFFNSTFEKDFYQLRLNDEVFETTLDELVDSLELIILILGATLVFTLINIGGLVITYSLRKRKFEFSILKVFGSSNLELILNLFIEVSIIGLVIIALITFIYSLASIMIGALIKNGSLVDFNYLPLTLLNSNIIVLLLILVLFIGSIEAMVSIFKINIGQSLKYD
jgi:ABC-type lipoprotein export system ATPase subunit